MKRGGLIATAAITVLALVLSALRLRPDGDLTAMFPGGPPIDALGEYVRAFHGGGAGIVLVRGSDASRVSAAAAAAVASMKRTPELGVEDANGGAEDEHPRESRRDARPARPDPRLGVRRPGRARSSRRRADARGHGDAAGRHARSAPRPRRR